MNPSTRTLLRKLLVRHESLRTHPYTDSTGHLSIGVGRNLTTRGISEAEAFYLLDDDMMWFNDKMTSTFPWFSMLDEARQVALIDLAFNIGMAGLLEFKNMLAALESGDYERAAECLLESRYAQQVGKRAQDLADILRTGEVRV